MEINITSKSDESLSKDTSYQGVDISNREIAYSLLQEGEITLSDLVKIVQKYPNDAECGAELRRILLTKKVKE